MVANWSADGAARKALADGDPKAGLIAILTGMGSLSYGELAGERMKLGLLLHDPEEEHDCFSDNTYNSHYYDAARHPERLYRPLHAASTARWSSGPSVAGARRRRPIRRSTPRLRGKLDATVAAMEAMQRARRERRGL